MVTTTSTTSNFEKIYKDLRKAGWTVEDIKGLLGDIEDSYYNETYGHIEDAREDFLAAGEDYLNELFGDESVDFTELIDTLRKELCKIEKTFATAQRIELDKDKIEKSDNEIVRDFFRTIGLDK